MAIEIEHKYLVNQELWLKVMPEKSIKICQGYLLNEQDKVVRIRIEGEIGKITIKGKAENASRLEYEYNIPLNDAHDLINKFCGELIEKTRHHVWFGNKLWEVDEFSGLNNGLMIAEIELKSQDEAYELPPWLDKNVTEDARYFNSNLAMQPYSTW